MHTLRIRHVNCCSSENALYRPESEVRVGSKRVNDLPGKKFLAACLFAFAFSHFWLRCNFIKIK